MTVSSEETESGDVIVHVSQPDNETDNDAPDVVVVNSESNSEGDLQRAEELGELRARVAQLEADLAEANARATVATAVAETAEETAEAALDAAEVAEVEAEEAAEEVAEEVAEEAEPQHEEHDESPHKVHFVHRPASEWFGGHR